ncbi:MAG: hypothetical protein IPK26_21095 [Planctomycetes bacterium]|nr:hypothetical protein [Planctomycetota bacterium]
MARAHAAAVVATIILGVGGWLYLTSTAQEPPPPPPPQQQSTDPTPTPLPATGQARERAPTPPPGPPPKATPTPPPLPDHRTDEPAPAPPTVHLHVVDAAGSRPIAAFGWRWRSGNERLNGEGQAGRADLTLPPGGRGELLVEADGYQPFLRAEVLVPVSSTPLRLDVPLTATATATGITLQIRDAQGQPLPHVRVDAFGPLAGEGSAWHVGKPLWSRRAEAIDGKYGLPELMPGRYGIRILALDADGATAPLLPWRQQFTLTGSNGFVEEIVLEPACVLECDFVDAVGNPVDPGNPPTIALSLRPAGGELVQRRWVVRAAGPIFAVDALPTVGTAGPEEPLGPGPFTLVISPPGRAPTQVELRLQAGRQRERVVVR